MRSQSHRSPTQDAPSSAKTSSRGRVRKMSRAIGRISVTERFLQKGKDALHGVTSRMRARLWPSTWQPSQSSRLHASSYRVSSGDDGRCYVLHQALPQPDYKEFMEAVIKEVNGHVDNNHWKLIPRMEVPESTEVVPSVWAMRCKRDLT